MSTYKETPFEAFYGGLLGHHPMWSGNMKLPASGSEKLVNCSIVIEKAPRCLGAYAPGVPGCVAAAKTRSKVIQLMREALALHVEGLRDDGDPIPSARAWSVEAEVGLARTA